MGMRVQREYLSKGPYPFRFTLLGKQADMITISMPVSGFCPGWE